MYNFFRSSHAYAGEPERIHVHIEWKMQRLAWLDTFVPGEIRGPLLREALRLRDGDPGEYAGWLYGMQKWGYPRGWTGVQNPIERAHRRILFGPEVDEGVENEELVIFGDGGDEEVINLASASAVRCHSSEDDVSTQQTLDAGDENVSDDLSSEDRTLSSASPSPSDTQLLSSTLPQASNTPYLPPPPPNSPPPLPPPPDPPIPRWATYRTPLFSSSHLTVYTGPPLPSLKLDYQTGVSLTYTPDREALWLKLISGQPSSPVAPHRLHTQNSLPPWRLPGAFSAFGPTGWQANSDARYGAPRPVDPMGQPERQSQPQDCEVQAAKDLSVEVPEVEEDMDMSD